MNIEDEVEIERAHRIVKPKMYSESLRQGAPKPRSIVAKLLRHPFAIVSGLR